MACQCPQTEARCCWPCVVTVRLMGRTDQTILVLGYASYHPVLLPQESHGHAEVRPDDASVVAAGHMFGDY